MSRAAVHSKLGTVDEEGNFRPAEISREEIDEARAEAAKAIAPLGHRAFNDLRPSEVEAASAAYLEPFVRGKLDQMREGPIDVELYEDYLHELVRLLVLQGRFSEAAELHPAAECHAVAALRPDSGEGAWCDCEVERVDDGMGGQVRQLAFERTETVSEVHGGIVFRYRCKCCGHTNVTAEPPPQDAWYYDRLNFHGAAHLADGQVLK